MFIWRIGIYDWVVLDSSPKALPKWQFKPKNRYRRTEFVQVLVVYFVIGYPLVIVPGMNRSCGTGEQTQGFVIASHLQLLYHLSHIPCPNTYLFYFLETPPRKYSWGSRTTSSDTQSTGPNILLLGYLGPSSNGSHLKYTGWCSAQAHQGYSWPYSGTSWYWRLNLSICRQTLCPWPSLISQTMKKLIKQIILFL